MRRQIVLVSLCAGLCMVVITTDPVAGARVASAPNAQTPPPATLSMADLEEMLGPIALYPDNLLANVLAASVYPDEITAASQFMKGGGATDAIDQQPWEPPVKSIAKIPEALDFLADNIEWTTAIGEVYIAQSQDVMAAIQTLRAKAKTSGALQSSEQMSVVESGSNIIIEQAQPEVIYVPQYNPQVVYAPAPAPVVVEDDDDELLAGVIGFGAGLMTAAIIDDDDWGCDWDNDCVGWGNNEIEVERNTNIETGDINIGSGNTVQGGDRTRNQGDRTNVQGGNKNTANNVGREGQKWQPNQQKVQERQAQSGGQRASDQFRGASSGTSAARSKVPTKTSAATTRQPSKPLAANNNKPSVTPAAANNRAGGSARNGGASAPKPATRQPQSRAAPTPKPKPKTPAAAPKPRTPSAAPKPQAKSRSSGVSPSRGSSKASSRGASSRGGGGGGRGGGGRGR